MSLSRYMNLTRDNISIIKQGEAKNLGGEFVG